MNEQLDLEKQILGQIIAYPGWKPLQTCLEYIIPEDFSNKINQDIFKTFIVMYKKDMPIDLLTIYREYNKRINRLPELVRSEKRQNIAYYLSTVSSNALPPTNIHVHCVYLMQESIKREMILLGAEMQQTDNFDDIFEKDFIFKEKFDEIIQRRIKNRAKTMNHITAEGFENVLQKHSGNVSWIKTYYQKLDDILGGLFNGELTYIAARPSVGKTAFALNLIKNQVDRGHRVLFYSLEMNQQAIYERLLALYSGINSFKIRIGKLSTDEVAEIEKINNELYSKPLCIDTETNLNFTTLKSRIEQEVSTSKPHVIYIDYLKLITPDDTKKSEYESITNISTELKRFAKKINIPLVVIHQLSRKSEDRKDKRPTMSDLRSSGQLEQDADNIILLHRPDYYEDSAEVPDPSACEVIIAKDRNGGTGKVEMSFYKKTSLFTEDISGVNNPSDKAMPGF